MNEKASWTFMVYMAGDNNLERFGYKDLNEMKSVGSSENVHIVAQFDSMADQVTRRYYISDGMDLSDDCVQVLAETNTGDPKVLEDFVTWAAGKHPAEHYGLILWNHGSGWKDDDIYRAAAHNGLTDVLTRGNIRSLRSGKPGRTLFNSSLEQLVKEAVARAILFDDSAADFLDSQEMRKVLENITPAVNGHLDLLGFDACLMNMIEVVYQVQDLCDVIVGSQEVEPGDGWPYDAILTSLVDNPDMFGEELAPVIVDEYVQHYATTSPYLTVTQSAVSASSIKSLTEAVDELAGVLLGSMNDSRTIGIVFAALRMSQTFTDKDYVDLGDFCSQLCALDPGSLLAQRAANVSDTIGGGGSPIIAQKSHGAPVSNATGLSIYIPTRVLSPLYDNLQFVQEYRWGDFLKEFVG